MLRWPWKRSAKRPSSLHNEGDSLGGLGMGGVQDGPKNNKKAADPSSMDGIQFFFFKLRR